MNELNQKQLLLKVLALGLIVLVNGCSSHSVKPKQQGIPKAPYSNSKLFGHKPALTKVEDIFKLSEQQHDDFMSFYNSHTNRHVLPNKKIYKYLQKYVKNYNFFNKTLTAEQSIAQAQGNCLSLAILTAALAKTVGVDTGYQLVESDPVFQKEGDVVISSQHVRSLLYNDSRTEKTWHMLLARPGIIIDYFPTTSSRIKKYVKNSEFHAMYYRNTAAEAFIAQDYNKTYWLVRESLDLFPTDEHAINIMALVHERKGLTSVAEKLYRHGIRFADEKLDLLRNYYQFLNKQHRFAEAKIIKTELATMKVVNPFDWISLGHTAFLDRKFTEAKRYYKKALRIAPYLHQGHLGVAKAEFKLGNIHASKASMKLAQKNAFDLKTRNLYQYKMNALAKF